MNFFYFQNKLRRRSQALFHGDHSVEPQHIEGRIHCGIYGVDDALLVAGLAATAAGTGMGVAASEQSQSAMNDVRAAETKRQTELQGQANQVFRKSLSSSGADTAKNKTADGAAQRQSIYNALKQAGQPAVGESAATTDSPDAVVDSDGSTRTANTLSKTRGGAWSTLTSNAATRQGGYQDYEADQALNDAEANRNLGVINNRARGWANIFPLELGVASHKGDALAGWGQLVSALGSVAGLGGAVGAGSGAGLSAANMAKSAGGVVDTAAPAFNPGAWSSVAMRTV